ncbi:MAG: hypothetical protein PWP54_1169 [Thermosipho sp. (in: thermotogales)]|jgi:hypothetical protein|nr:hypothetical protein [Thermosipho sp. (in: thermotogales)]
MKNIDENFNFINYFFFGLFLVIGVLNFILVSIVPGFFYIILSLLYLPLFDKKIKKALNFKFYNLFKILLALFVLWGTLAVGDLMEFFESKILNK